MHMEYGKHSLGVRKTVAGAAVGALCASIFVGYEVSSHQKSDQSCPAPQPLEKVSFTIAPRPNYVGQVEVINNGPCAAVYDRESLKTVATIATGDSFAVTCADSKPNSFQVAVGQELGGYVNYANDLRVSNAGNGYDHPLIPGC